MVTLHSCRDFLKQKWEQSTRSRFGRLQLIARPGPGKLWTFSLPNSQRTSAPWKLNQSSSPLATCYPILLSLVRHYVCWFILCLVLITIARNPGGKKTPQEGTHPTPNINRLWRIRELLDEAITKRSQSALKDLMCTFYPWNYAWLDIYVNRSTGTTGLLVPLLASVLHLLVVLWLPDAPTLSHSHSMIRCVALC